MIVDESGSDSVIEDGGTPKEAGFVIRGWKVGWTWVWGNEDGWSHADLFVVVDAPFFLAVVPVEEGMLECGIVVLPTRVELMELIRGPWV